MKLNKIKKISGIFFILFCIISSISVSEIKTNRSNHFKNTIRSAGPYDPDIAIMDNITNHEIGKSQNLTFIITDSSITTPTYDIDKRYELGSWENIVNDFSWTSEIQENVTLDGNLTSLGFYEFRVSASDGENISIAIMNITVVNTSPIIVLENTPDSILYGSSFELNFTVTDNSTSNALYNITYIVLYDNGTLFSDIFQSDSSYLENETIVNDTSTIIVDGGEYQFDIGLYDGYNGYDIESRNVTVNNTYPVITWVTPPKDSYILENQTFEFIITDSDYSNLTYDLFYKKGEFGTWVYNGTYSEIESEPTGLVDWGSVESPNYDWIYTYSASIYIVDYASEEDVFKFTDQSTKGGEYVGILYEGDHTFEFDVAVDHATREYRIGCLGTGIGEFAYYLQFIGGNMYWDGNNIGTYTSGTWYHVKIIQTENSPTSYSADLWIDDINYGTDSGTITAYMRNQFMGYDLGGTGYSMYLNNLYIDGSEGESISVNNTQQTYTFSNETFLDGFNVYSFKIIAKDGSNSGITTSTKTFILLEWKEEHPNGEKEETEETDQWINPLGASPMKINYEIIFFISIGIVSLIIINQMAINQVNMRRTSKIQKRKRRK